MTPKELASYVRFNTRTNSSTFTDADILMLMKIRQDELAKDILDADEDILLIPQYSSLVANQREYSLPTDMLSSIKRVEAKLDGTNFIKLNELDIVSLQHSILSETEITNNFSNEDGKAYFDLTRKSLYIYSGTISDVADGLKIWVNSWPTAISDLTSEVDMSVDPSTTTFGIPRELHEIWARGIIIDYKGSRENPIPLSEQELNYGIDKIRAINSLKPQNLDREVIGSTPFNDGSQY